MRRKSLGLFVVLALFVAACGGDDDAVDVGPDEAVIQISSEGGFVPVEFALGQGPRYTVLGDGTLIFPGFTTLEFPGRLIPPYMTAQLDDNQMNALLAMVDDMGLADIVDETDDDAADFVADAATEVIRFWDSAGEHRYSVYALGIEEDPSERNATLLELIATLDEFTAQAPGEPYQPDRVRVVAGPGAENPDFPDLRPWPLDEEWEQWAALANGWQCRVYEADVLSRFEDATQATTWEMPEGGLEFDPANLLVRPLHPGEPDCPV
jgi:hypothetical protein